MEALDQPPLPSPAATLKRDTGQGYQARVFIKDCFNSKESNFNKCAQRNNSNCPNHETVKKLMLKASKANVGIHLLSLLILLMSQNVFAKIPKKVPSSKLVIYYFILIF